jgi:hypothetical protein
VVANAAMKLGKNEIGGLEDEKPRNFWQRLVSAATEIKNGAREKTETHEPKEKHAKHKAQGEGFEEGHTPKYSVRSAKHEKEKWQDESGMDGDEPAGYSDRFKPHSKWKDKAARGGDGLHTAV